QRPDATAEVAGEPRRLPLGALAAQALALGLLTGLVGVGGGFLIVPALVVLGRVPMKRAVGTSLLVITMNSAAGFLGYLGTVEVAWGVLAAFAAAAAGGILVGTRLSRLVPQAALQRAFAVFLVVMGTFILYQNRGVILPHPSGPPATAAGH
ncbi:MAG TPA: sulfite exporter TauE/SafE family protein, partial [Longimicrobium sp.]|nr:sulfite exporter TauE/SafE family protein [Longimicrobium sp.]